MSDLPPYSQPYTKCLKCGQHMMAATAFVSATAVEAERLQRSCRNCGFRWSEACVDE